MNWETATKEEQCNYLNSLKDKWMYESPDGGKTIYRRKFFEKKKELLTTEHWEYLSQVKSSQNV